MKTTKKVLVVDFGGQYSQLIARRVRECRVYSELMPYDTPVERDTGGRSGRDHLLGRSAERQRARRSHGRSRDLLTLGVPVLGICYGLQLMAKLKGGRVERLERGRVRRAAGDRDRARPALRRSARRRCACWMSHGDSVVRGAPGLHRDGREPQHAGGRHGGSRAARLYGVQFHPEVRAHRARAGDPQELPLQGLRHRPDVDAGLHHRRGGGAHPGPGGQRARGLRAVRRRRFGGGRTAGLQGGRRSTDLHLRRPRPDAQERGRARWRTPSAGTSTCRWCTCGPQERFLAKLAGVTEPEQKRKIIGEEFIRTFEEESHKLGKAKFLVQGTIYPDVIESGTKSAAVIKSHHNVGGLPDDVDFELVEPLRMLFKDEVRVVGEELGLPEDMVWRQPFPGPGLAIRIIGEVTPERLDILREADAILLEEVKKAGLYRELWQTFAVLPAIRSVGVMGDERTYAYPIIIRAVTSDDAMTADWARLPYDLLEIVSQRIINEVPGVNRVALDISSKPPSTIEWE